MAAVYSNGGNCWNILGFNFTKRDALSSVYKISMVRTSRIRSIARWNGLGVGLNCDTLEQCGLVFHMENN